VRVMAGPTSSASGCGRTRATTWASWERGWPREPTPYSRRFHSLLSILTEIYLWHTCSCHEILRMNTPRQARWTSGAPAEVAAKLEHETAQNPQKHAARKVLVKWLSPELPERERRGGFIAFD
jgi:hypothetical protein